MKRFIFRANAANLRMRREVGLIVGGMQNMEISAESPPQVFHCSNLDDRQLIGPSDRTVAILEFVLHPFKLLLPSIRNSFYPKSGKMGIGGGRLKRAPMKPRRLVVVVFVIAKIVALLPGTLTGEMVIFR